jgi:putative glutamine amidotransferase
VGSNGSEVLIGISCYLEQARFGVWDVPAALLPRGYLDCVVAAGGTPVLLPPGGEWSGALLSRLDGLVLAGGPDIDATRYGQQRHPDADPPRTERDTTELRLLDAALERAMPVLGVCRGVQVLNVGLGGTLRQHLPDDLGSTDHRPELGRFGQVDVAVAPQSRLAGLVGDRLKVSCHHHQGIDRLGAGLIPVAWAADGSVEAVERSGDGFVLGVQWHPEEDTTDVRLFRALVAAARGER